MPYQPLRTVLAAAIILAPALLWGQAAAAISYAMDNRQYVTITAGDALFTFALPAGQNPGSAVPGKAR